MRTWQLNAYNIDDLKIEDKPIPKIVNQSDVLIQMKSASLNFRDLIMIDGGYGPTGGDIPFVPISDGSGIVIETGDSVTKFKKGDIVTIPFFKDWDSGDIDQNTYLSALGGLVDGVMRDYIVYSENKIVKKVKVSGDGVQALLAQTMQNKPSGPAGAKRGTIFVPA